MEPSFPNAGMALDLAGGLGRHALWLATRKWRVSVVDLSEVAIGKLRQAAGQLNVETCLFAQDAAEFNFKAARFDLILLFYHLDRRLFPKIVAALSPGGLFVCKMAVQWDMESGLPTVGDNPLCQNELVSLVPDLDVVDHRTRPIRARGVVEFVGRKRGLSVQ